jgi:hypothetical protein
VSIFIYIVICELLIKFIHINYLVIFSEYFHLYYFCELVIKFVLVVKPLLCFIPTGDYFINLILFGER